MHAQEILPAETIAALAARYDLDPDSRGVKECVGYALAEHGKETPSYDGCERRFPMVDPITRRVDAARYLEWELNDMAHTAAADCASIGSFHNAAFGSDD